MQPFLTDDLVMLIAASDPSIRCTIASIINLRFPNINLIERENGASALLDLDQDNIHLAILHSDLPFLNGLEVVEKYNSKSDTKTKFILLCDSLEIDRVHKAKELSFSGFLYSDDLSNEVEACINAILNNSCYLSKSMSMLLQKHEELSKKLSSLSQTEILFLNEIKDGKNHLQISDKLVLSTKSINQITSSISKKLQLPQKETAITNWIRDHESIFN